VFDVFNVLNMSNGSLELEKNSARIGARVPQTLRDRLERLASEARMDISDVVRIGLITQIGAIERVVLMRNAAPDLALDSISQVVATVLKAKQHGIDFVDLVENEVARRFEAQPTEAVAS
jgi:hypothetical protein